MSTSHRKGYAAFVFVLCVSAPTQGSSPMVKLAAGSTCQLRAVVPQSVASMDASSRALPNEVLLAPQAEGSYGWSTGRLVHPEQRTCLSRVPRSAVGLAFRACDANDRSQLWQWKTKPAEREGVTLSVLQHQFTGQVLERVRAEQGDVFGLADYRVGADTQRFSLRGCNN